MQHPFNPVRLDAVKWRLHLHREGTAEQVRRLVYGLLQSDTAADEAHKNKKGPQFSLRSVNRKWAEVCT